MAALTPIPFSNLVRRMRAEATASRAIFDLPVRKWFVPDATFDFSAFHFDRRAAAPVGPAAGPHTQLAQNIVLSWLAGSRIIELKTVQVNDRLDIPRPCIHVPNVGYNVEWSQELRVEESILEYAKAVYLIEILKATRGFGVFPGTHGFDTIYDISVGYDLEGIRSEKVTGFLHALRKPAAILDRLRGQLSGDLAEFRDLELPSSISQCVTLSTFHGCPADQIEAIGRYLLGECGLHTIIKLNPTLLGFDGVRELLVGRLGYRDLELRRAAFEHDLMYDDALQIMRNLRALAESRGSTIGAKFTNTLVVANDGRLFPTQRDPYMYVSGPPLHVISMQLMQRFREDVGFEFPVSFSAGVDARNFPETVACGMVPVTTCTDLLRQGGYGRLPPYLRALGGAMKKVGVSSREAYVLAAFGHGAEAAAEALRRREGGAAAWEKHGERLARLARDAPDDLPRALREVAGASGLDGDALVLNATRIAGRLNGRHIVPALADDPRYHAAANAKEPRTIDSRLGLYDCINCDLCIPACPNDAMFAYTVTPVDVETERIRCDRDGRVQREAGVGFTMREEHQLAVLEGACNECSNCEVYCPEVGAPFRLKERIFLSAADFRTQVTLDGFCREGNTLFARLDGSELRLEFDDGQQRATLVGNSFAIALRWDPLSVEGGSVTGEAMALDTAVLWRLKTVWGAIFRSRAANMVNTLP